MASPTVEYTETLLQAEAQACRDKGDWLQHGRQLAMADTNRQLSIGDWLVAGEKRWQKTAYTLALTVFTGYTRATLRNLAYVARNVPVSLRNDNLSFNHYVAVARFGNKPDLQKQLLNKATANGWFSKQLRTYVKENYPPASESKPEIELDSAARYQKLCAFVTNLYGSLPAQQQAKEIREHAQKLIDEYGAIARPEGDEPCATVQ